MIWVPGAAKTRGQTHLRLRGLGLELLPCASPITFEVAVPQQCTTKPGPSRFAAAGGTSLAGSLTSRQKNLLFSFMVVLWSFCDYGKGFPDFL